MLIVLLLTCGDRSPCDPPSYGAPCYNWNCELDGLVCHDEGVCYAPCSTDADCDEWKGWGDDEFSCVDGACRGPFCSGDL